MKASPSRCHVSSLRRLNGFTCGFNFYRTLMFAALLFPLFACGQSFTLEKTFTRSISGEFIIYGAPQLSALAR